MSIKLRILMSHFKSPPCQGGCVSWCVGRGILGSNLTQVPTTHLRQQFPLSRGLGGGLSTHHLYPPTSSVIPDLIRDLPHLSIPEQ